MFEIESKESYEFGRFRLDVTEHLLVRLPGERRVQLSEKAFETLCVLVQNAGHLLSKEEILNQVWTDSFVEENNLDKCIYAIRRALGEKPGEQKFVETVRKHGYRFVADVRRTEARNEQIEPTQNTNVEQSKTKRIFITNLPRFVEEVRPQNSAAAVVALADWRHEADEKTAEESAASERPTEPTEKLEPTLPISIGNDKRKLNYRASPLFAAFALTVIFTSAIALGGWVASGSRTKFEAAILSAPFAAEKLSTNGKVHHAVISPDGKNVVYTNITSGNKRSVWLRNLETGDNVEIIVQSDDIYFGLALAPDGNFLYFARRPRNVEGQADIYRVSVFGGIPQKIVGEAQGWISLSPDGAQISFVRCYYRQEEFCSLWIADSADGRNERKLAVRPRPFRIRDIEFSPDGKLIAFANGQSENASNNFSLSAIDLETGAESQLTTEKFFNIKGLAWLPDQTALLIAASRVPNKNYRIWQVSAATGKAEPLTNDSECYSDLSLDKTANRLVATRIKEDFRLRILNLENAADSQVLADAGTIAFAPDGKIFYSSTMSGNDEIWSVNPNGDEQKQLTNDPADDNKPIVAPDNKAIYFASNRTGASHVWRMNADGSLQTQMTRETGGFPLFVSPDNEWLYYHHGIDRTLWRVSTRGGKEQMVLNKIKYRFAVSPDGSQVAFGEKINGEDCVVIVSLADGQTIKTFRYAASKTKLLEIAWTPDKNGIIYILADNEYRHNVLWLQPLDERETPTKIADLGEEKISEGGGFALAPDGKRFAVSQGGWLHDAVLLKGLK